MHFVGSTITKPNSLFGRRIQHSGDFDVLGWLEFTAFCLGTNTLFFSSKKEKRGGRKDENTGVGDDRRSGFGHVIRLFWSWQTTIWLGLQYD